MTKNKLYTLILEYEGGTYVSQVSGASPAAALRKWLSILKDADLAQWRITRAELDTIMKSEKVVPLDGCTNVWCISGSGKYGLVLINIITTEESA